MSGATTGGAGRRAARARARIALAVLPAALATLAAPAARAQSMLDRSPNVEGTWTLPRWAPTFVFAHRFEALAGGDELINVPSLALALGLPLGFTAGLEYSSNSEIVPARLGANETEYWLKGGTRVRERGAVALIGAYNTAARSADGAVTARLELPRVALLGEVRGFSDRFGSGEAGSAAAAGVILRLTRLLALSGDVGRVLGGGDSLGTTWSAGLALAIPGSPHTLAVYGANSGAATLQGTSRDKVIGPGSRRWGFTFTVPLGSGRQWRELVRQPAPPPARVAGDTVRVVIQMVAYGTPEVRIRRGQVVEWVNLDPIAHTATADDGAWDSGMLAKDARWSRRFDRAGRYAYHCTPHPQMRGVVIVEE